MDGIQTKVIVVGAGPAGSVCAYLLLQSGVEVTLIDKAEFPRDKTCGGGLTPKAYRLLDEIYPDLQYDYNAVHHIKVTVNGRATCEFDGEREIRIVKRKEFDHVLLKQYLKAGGRFVNVGLKAIDEEGDGTIGVTLTNGERLLCDYLVGADGANSRVKNYLSPNKDRKVLILEQYVGKGANNEIEIGLSKLDVGGYYYRFPNNTFDAVGFCNYHTTTDRFRSILKEKGMPETKLKGAYITISTDYPLHDRIILIGDAGGFCNRLTYEGLFYAIQTAKNASDAIATKRPFSEVNNLYFRKKKQEHWKTRLFYSGFGMWFSEFCCQWPRLVKFCFDKNV